MDKLKFSVVGFGRIGKRHAKIIQEFDSTELISVVDTDSDQFEGIKELGLKYRPLKDSMEDTFQQLIDNKLF